MITWNQVEKLDTVYWWALEASLCEMTESLRNVVYFCMGKLDESVAGEQGFKMEATFKLGLEHLAGLSEARCWMQDAGDEYRKYAEALTAIHEYCVGLVSG